jgi:hypothetical protein
MSDTKPRPEGYEEVTCDIRLPGCTRILAGYLRRPQFAQAGDWRNSCEHCARIPYEQPKQFQEATSEQSL